MGKLVNSAFHWGQGPPTTASDDIGDFVLVDLGFPVERVWVVNIVPAQLQEDGSIRVVGSLFVVRRKILAIKQSAMM